MLCEKVTVKTPSGDLEGHLFVGADGLPELTVEYEHAAQVGMYVHTGPLRYRPATIPASWLVTSPTCGTLYGAWDDISEIIKNLVIAGREYEAQLAQPTDAREGR